MIYIASPYNHPDPNIREERYQRVLDFTARLMIEERMVVYSPIVHNHPIAVKHGLPTGWDFWNKFDHQMVSRATKLIVFTDDGWDTSKGVAAEILIAQDCGIPIHYMSK
jgi:hypothetical protein